MAWGPWDIADGQLSDTPETVLYSVVETGILGEVLMTNTSGSEVTVNIYVDRTGANRRIGGKDVPIPAGGYKRISVAVAVKNGDVLSGDASTTAVVDFVLSGVKDA